VKAEEYNARLAAIGVLVKARNFLVFQGDVENVASRDSRELTALIEQVAGSDELKKRFDELRVAKEAAEEETIAQFTKKKSMAAEKKQYKEQKDEAEQFQALLLKQEELKRDQAMWQLRGIEQESSAKAKELAQLQAQLKAEETKNVRSEVSDALADVLL